MPERPKDPDSQFAAYQLQFRVLLTSEIERILKAIGIETAVEVVLVNYRDPSLDSCPISTAGARDSVPPLDIPPLEARALALYRDHPRSRMVFSHKQYGEARHQALLDDMRARALADALGNHPSLRGKVFYGRIAGEIMGRWTYVLVGVAAEALRSLPRLVNSFYGMQPLIQSFLDAVVIELLSRACASYRHGGARGLSVTGIGTSELIRTATGAFIGSVLSRADDMFGEDADLVMNVIASLPYEGRAGSGRFVFAQQGHPDVEVLMRLRSPLDIRENRRAVRKLMEVCHENIDLLVSEQSVFGLGYIKRTYDRHSESVFSVSVVGRGAWDLCHDDCILLSVRDGSTQIPKPVLDLSYLREVLGRVIPNADISALSTLAEAAGDNEHGAMLVISSAAKSEAQRLSPQAWQVEPVSMTSELLSRLTAMDGAVLVDADGVCHAIGVILDGQAAGRGDPARGSRYNNVVRYLDSEPPSAVVIVYSADGNIDIFPQLMPRVSRLEVESAVHDYLTIASIRPPNLEHLIETEKPLERLRFYLSEEQCRRLNEAQEAADDWRHANGSPRVLGSTFQVDPRMDQSYWLD